LSTWVAGWCRKDPICHVKLDKIDRKMTEKKGRRERKTRVSWHNAKDQINDKTYSIKLFLKFILRFIQIKRHYMSRSIYDFNLISKKSERIFMASDRKSNLVLLRILERQCWDWSLIALVRHRQRQKMQQCRRNVEQDHVKTNLFVWLIQLWKPWNDRSFG
jgi:hypothetical protein